MNLYAYVHNDPISFVDPFGLNSSCPSGQVHCGGNKPIPEVNTRGASNGRSTCGGGCTSMTGPAAQGFIDRMVAAQDRINSRINGNPNNWIRHDWAPSDADGYVEARRQQMEESADELGYASGAIIVTPLLLVEAPIS